MVDQFLLDRTVLVTREASQARDLANQISHYGGVPIVVPLLTFVAANEATVFPYFQKLANYHWLVLTSQAGVKQFFQFLEKYHLHLPETIKIAVIGSKTKEALEAKGYDASFTPPTYVAEVFLPNFLAILNKHEKILVCKGDLARSYIADGLRTNGLTVDEVIIYQNQLPENASEKLVTALHNQALDILLFTSPSTIANFVQIVQNERLHVAELLKDKLIVTIGPVTKKKAEEIGLTVMVSPEQYTVSHMLTALQEHLQAKRRGS